MDVKMANAFFNFSSLGIENLFFLPTISEISPAVWKAHLEISRHTVQSNPDPRHTRDSSSAMISKMKSRIDLIISISSFDRIFFRRIIRFLSHTEI